MRRFWRIKNPTYRGAVVGLVCALACCLLNETVVMRGAENWALDNCFVLRGKRSTTANVVVVGIDEDSLRELKKPLAFVSPEMSEVVRFLDAEGASAIGIDFFIPADAEDREYFRPGADGDADQLGKAIAQSKKVVLPEWQLGDEWLSPLFQWKTKNDIDPAWTDLGFVNLTTDNDTFLRRQQMRAKTKDNEAKNAIWNRGVRPRREKSGGLVYRQIAGVGREGNSHRVRSHADQLCRPAWHHQNGSVPSRPQSGAW